MTFSLDADTYSYAINVTSDSPVDITVSSPCSTGGACSNGTYVAYYGTSSSYQLALQAGGTVEQQVITFTNAGRAPAHVSVAWTHHTYANNQVTALGNGIPEFPSQPLAAVGVALVVVLSYLFLRKQSRKQQANLSSLG